MDSQTFIASGTNYPSYQPYHLRRLNYLTYLQWNPETRHLVVRVNDVEVGFNYDRQMVTLDEQPNVGDVVTLSVEVLNIIPSKT